REQVRRTAASLVRVRSKLRSAGPPRRSVDAKATPPMPAIGPSVSARRHGFPCPARSSSRKCAPEPLHCPLMIDSTRYPRLARIESPSDLRRFDEADLPAVAREVRDYLIESVSTSGGH